MTEGALSKWFSELDSDLDSNEDWSSDSDYDNGTVERWLENGDESNDYEPLDGYSYNDREAMKWNSDDVAIEIIVPGQDVTTTINIVNGQTSYRHVLYLCGILSKMVDADRGDYIVLEEDREQYTFRLVVQTSDESSDSD